ncbi:MAG: hypothetical protein V4488_12315 [Pseudomonadota bacterium]
MPAPSPRHPYYLSENKKCDPLRSHFFAHQALAPPKTFMSLAMSPSLSVECGILSAALCIKFFPGLFLYLPDHIILLHFL